MKAKKILGWIKFVTAIIAYITCVLATWYAFAYFMAWLTTSHGLIGEAIGLLYVFNLPWTVPLTFLIIILFWLYIFYRIAKKLPKSS
jgi:uncharacterized membrane protein